MSERSDLGTCGAILSDDRKGKYLFGASSRFSGGGVRRGQAWSPRAQDSTASWACSRCVGLASPRSCEGPLGGPAPGPWLTAPSSYTYTHTHVHILASHTLIHTHSHNSLTRLSLLTHSCIHAADTQLHHLVSHSHTHGSHCSHTHVYIYQTHNHITWSHTHMALSAHTLMYTHSTPLTITRIHLVSHTHNLHTHRGLTRSPTHIHSTHKHSLSPVRALFSSIRQAR